MSDPTIEEVDAFVSGYKSLDGYLSPWKQEHGWDWNARWGLLDIHGRRLGELVFTINASLTRPTISATYRRKLIYRVDIVPMDEIKPNDFGALGVGLPAMVQGPHTHPWPEHREFVRQNGYGDLPFRKPVSIVDGQFIRALEVAASDLNIHVEPSQRTDCGPPPQAVLFADRHGL